MNATKLVLNNEYIDEQSYKFNVTVAVDDKDNSSQYITLDRSTSLDTTTARYNAKNEAIANVDAIKVLRKEGTTLQSPVTCKVNVTVKDQWGVSTVIPVNITVNPIQ